MNFDDQLKVIDSAMSELFNGRKQKESAIEIATMINKSMVALNLADLRLGANTISVNGKSVDVWVESISGGSHYLCASIDWDIGDPIVIRSSIAAAVHDFRKLMEAREAEANGECIECKRVGECDDCDVEDPS